MTPGETLVDADAPPITANVGRATVTLTVRHAGDRPIQIGSHFHFFEVNRSLIFDRAHAYGMHLNIPAGTAVRFEPGDEKEVTLVDFAGERIVYGGNSRVQGRLDDPALQEHALTQIAIWQASGHAPSEKATNK